MEVCYRATLNKKKKKVLRYSRVNSCPRAENVQSEKPLYNHYSLCSWSLPNPSLTCKYLMQQNVTSWREIVDCWKRTPRSSNTDAFGWCLTPAASPKVFGLILVHAQKNIISILYTTHPDHIYDNKAESDFWLTAFSLHDGLAAEPLILR